tara:strand:+ start:417 stop:1076 length:660 start_codon:yes stop_codon:yes gene_type:complete
MVAHDLRFLQIQVNVDQAKLLPGVKMLDFFSTIEFVSTISTNSDYPEYILSLNYQNDRAIEAFKNSNSFDMTSIIEEKPGCMLVTAKATGPLPMLVRQNPEVWIQTPTILSKTNGLFMTIHGTTKGLKKFRDEVSQLLPPNIKIRISKELKADYIAAPQLPNRRKEVMEMAVKLGYYNTPRKCTQRDLAEALGVRQGTVAEHLQSAESMIIQSWADQAK